MAQSWKPSDPNYDPKTLRGEDILKDVKRRGKEFSDYFSDIWQAIPEGTRCWHSRLSYWITEPWDNHNGTITLVGDSAHSMTFRKSPRPDASIDDYSIANVYTRSRSRSEQRHQ